MCERKRGEGEVYIMCVIRVHYICGCLLEAVGLM